MKTRLLLVCLPLLCGAALAQKSNASPSVCELATHLERFVGQTFTLHVPVTYHPSDTVTYGSELGVTTKGFCGADHKLPLSFDANSPDGQTRAFLAKVEEVIQGKVSNCYCLDCPKYAVKAELQVTVKKWQDEPPPKSGSVIKVKGERPLFQLVLDKVLSFKAYKVHYNCAK